MILGHLIVEIALIFSKGLHHSCATVRQGLLLLGCGEADTGLRGGGRTSGQFDVCGPELERWMLESSIGRAVFWKKIKGSSASEWRNPMISQSNSASRDKEGGPYCPLVRREATALANFHQSPAFDQNFRT